MINKKLKFSDIHLFLKQQVICEGQDIPVEGNDSLDAQVDKLLMSYIANADNVVQEAEEKEKSKPDSKETSTKKSIEDIDVRTLCGEVSNLVDNINNLIEFKNTILRRTLNTLNKTYDQTVVRQFEIIMEDEYSLAIGKSEKDLADEIVVPTADRAGPVS